MSRRLRLNRQQLAGFAKDFDTIDQFERLFEEVSALGDGWVISVNGNTGVVVLTKADVGLGNVDNTSDVNKPVSTAQATAIGLKEDYLGTPAADGDILSSTVAGVRSWVAPGGGGITEAPIDGNIYARQDAAWVLAQGAQMTFDTTLDFGTGGTMATATVADATMTTTKIIQAFFTDYLDEVAVLNMRVNERSRTAGVSFDIIGIAPPGAFGTYPVRIITSGI